MILHRVVVIAVASSSAGACLALAAVRLVPDPERRSLGWAAWLLLAALVNAGIVATNYAAVSRVVADLALDDPATYQIADRRTP